MKKIIMAAAMSAGIIMFGVPFALAQTASTTTIPPRMTIQQEINYLDKEVQLLIAELEAMNTAQQSLTAQVQATTPVLGSAATVPTPARPFFVYEEAHVNFGSGFLRGADMQNNFPTVLPGQTINGELSFMCTYDSAEPGLPNFCTVPAGATSSLPQISQVPITVKIGETTSTIEATPNDVQVTTSVTTDANGNFSFTIPGNCTIKTYHVSIYNGSKYMLDFYAHNSTSKNCSLSGN